MALRTGMTTRDFWGASLCEVEAVLRAYRSRCWDDMQRLAWHAAYTMAPHCKKAPQPIELLPESGDPEYIAPLSAHRSARDFDNAAGYSAYMRAKDEEREAAEYWSKAGAAGRMTRDYFADED